MTEQLYQTKSAAVRMQNRKISMKEQKRLIDEFCDKYRPQVIEEYEENGVTVTRYGMA